MSDPERRNEKESRPGEDVTLVDYVHVIWRYKWVLVGIWVLVLLGSYVATVTTSRVYEATTTVMAPREGGAIGFLGGLAGSGIGAQLPGVVLQSLTPNRDVLISLLKSRTMAEEIVRRFGLRERYDARYLDETVKRLQRVTNVFVSKEGVISIKVEDTSPQIAADIANYYVEHLDRLVAEYSTGDAGRKRRFISEQLARAKKDLASGEEVLRNFQERNRAFVLQEQTRGAIEAAARLKGEIQAADVQLQVLRAFATEANPDVVALRRRIDEMQRQLGQMQYGDGVPAPASALGREQRDFSVPFSRVPAVGLELARMTRDVKTQETVVTLLTQQFEQAKIDEAKDMPAVQVLDRAVVPERHVKPRLRDNLLIAGAAALFGSLVLVFFLEYLRGLRHRVSTA